MKDEDIILSVIIPYRNRKDLLEATLESLSRQINITDDIEVIFIDNNSSKECHDSVTSWIEGRRENNITYCHYIESKAGASAARNCGVSLSRGSRILFFDSDDIMQPHFISTVLSAIKSHDDKDLLYWDIETEDNKGKKHIKKGKGKDRDKKVILNAIWSTGRYVVKKDFLLKTGGWDESLEIWVDWELSVRMLTNSPRVFYFDNKPQVIKLQHDNSLTGKRFYTDEGKREKAVMKALSFIPAKRGEKQRMLVEIKGYLLAAQYRREGNMTLARNLLDKLDGIAVTSRHISRCVYYWHRFIGRGASHMANIMLGFSTRSGIQNVTP